MWPFDLFKKKPEPQVIDVTPKVIDVTPRAEFGYRDGKIVINSYNAAFVQDLRNKLGEAAHERSDDQVVQLFLDRENLEREEPRLECLHLGIDDDGRVKMKLDWNRAFIEHLKEHGITAEDEEEAIRQYLSLITADVARDMGMGKATLTEEDIEEAFKEINEVTAAELEEARKQAEEMRKSRRRRRAPKDQK